MNYHLIVSSNCTRKTKSVLLVFCLVVTMIFTGGCKKYLDLDPPKTEVLDAALFTSDANAKAAIAGLYVTMSNDPAFGYGLTTTAGFLADELNYLDNYNDAYIKNNIFPTDQTVGNMWTGYYKIIYDSNSLIKQVQASIGMTEAYKKQLIGEAKFIRAYAHFYLINLFGSVPLITTTDVTQTALAPRSQVADVYAQIIADLTDAQSLLPSDYSISGGARTRVNQWAATALLARVYLYRKEWAKAEAQSSTVIGGSLFSLQSTTNIAKAFQANNSEAIFQLASTRNVSYTLEGSNFLGVYVANGIIPYPLTPGLLTSFEPGDARKNSWVFTLATNSTAYKYKGDSFKAPPAPESYVVLRLAEQYLIRAEARAEQGNVAGAQTDLNTIRNRAGLANTTAGDKAALLQAVEQESRIELFCELGHRWFDLKRRPSLVNPSSKTRADDILGALKTGWKSSVQLLPIPSNEILNNPNLTQNPGY